MMEPNSGSPGNKNAGRNPLFIFFGFLLIGAALGVLIFGGAFASSRESAVGGDAEERSLLDQVPAISDVGENGNSARSGGSGKPGYLTVGDRALTFTLDDLDGNQVSLDDFAGQPVIVNFWATWCAPCRIEMPELQAAYEKYRDQGLVILALDQDEPAEVARRFFYDEMGLTFTPLLDEGSATALAYGSAQVLPSTYFIRSDGVISAIHRGPLTESQINAYLNDLGLDA